MNFKKKITLKYSGWELNFFDNAKVFRNYQFNFIRKHIKGNVCEVGPGNGVICDKYIYLSKKISLFAGATGTGMGIKNFACTHSYLRRFTRALYIAHILCDL